MGNYAFSPQVKLTSAFWEKMKLNGNLRENEMSKM